LSGQASAIEHGESPGDAEFDAAAELVATRLVEAEHHERKAASARLALTSVQEAAHAIETRIRQEVRDLARVERTTLVGLRDELVRRQLELTAPPEESASIADLIEWTSAVLDAGGRELRRLRDLAQSENEAAKTKTNGRETVAALGFDDSTACGSARSLLVGRPAQDAPRLALICAGASCQVSA